MSDHTDWLWRPVVRGLCRMESLKDGTLDLADFAAANEALDVDETNRAAIIEALKRRG